MYVNSFQVYNLTILQDLNYCKSIDALQAMLKSDLVGDLVDYQIYEPPCEKTGLRGFRPGPTQTGLCSHRRWLEA